MPLFKTESEANLLQGMFYYSGTWQSVPSFRLLIISIAPLLQLERSFQACIIFNLFKIHNIIDQTASYYQLTQIRRTVGVAGQRKTLITFKACSRAINVIDIDSKLVTFKYI